MAYRGSLFRMIEKKMWVVPMGGFRDVVKGFPGWKEGDCLLTYGYIDHDAGLTLEVLACGKRTRGNSFSFLDGNDEISAKIRLEQVADEDLNSIDYEGTDLWERYEKKLQMLEAYDPGEEILGSRKREDLDKYRDVFYVDDVLVYLLKDGLDPEGCWVRISGMGEGYLVGELLNEPNQDFGYHLGERIAFETAENDQGETFLCANLNPLKTVTREELEDGSVLSAAIRTLYEENSMENYLEVLELLRDSTVWVPGTMVLSEEDQAAWEKVIDEAGEDKESLIGTTLTNQDEIRFEPDILQNGEDLYYPVFSSVEEMGEYGDHFSKVQRPFTDVILLARNDPHKVNGIVVNAFTQPFELPEDRFDIVANMKSRIVEK